MYFDSLNKIECCGCQACADICQVEAVTFNNDDEGFWYPLIDKSKCTGCNRCKEVCPLNNNVLRPLNDTGQIYAAYATNEIVLNKSSSGGIFSLLSDIVLMKNGIIVGCCLKEGENLLQAVHVIALSGEQRDRCCGSKYVQSNTSGIYKKIKEELNNDNYVLFSGTPCQNSALKKYLGEDNDKLLQIDLICHGVPSPGIFFSYIQMQEKIFGKRIIDFKFRGKEKGWQKRIRTIIFEDGSIEPIPKDNFYYLFVHNFILRPTCYVCPFAGRERVADITLGDFWGVQNECPDMFNDDKGVSVVFLNTEKGKKYFDEIACELIKTKKVFLNMVIQKNTPLRKAVSRNYERKRFFHTYKKKGLEICFKKYCYPGFCKRAIRRVSRLFYNSFGILQNP
jgi:coenzyme F420-reducing hydrogenase beta subunit